MNRVYVNQPYTQQSGGCGDPGLHIHLTPEYLTDEAQAAWWGPRGMFTNLLNLMAIHFQQNTLTKYSQRIIVFIVLYDLAGKVLLQEWAKLRWGVFDELGYPGDESFPLFYIWDESSGGASDGGTILPTYCANVPVEGRRM